MSKRTYTQVPCMACGKYIGNSGAAQAAHHKMHVRDGLMEAEIDYHPIFGYPRSTRYVLTKAGWDAWRERNPDAKLKQVVGKAD